MTARCFCHELAHLDGQLYTDLADRIYTTEELDAMLEERGEMTILFMGTPDFAVPSLEALIAAGHDRLRRIHPAGPAEKQGNEAPGTTCKADSPCT